MKRNKPPYPPIDEKPNTWIWAALAILAEALLKMRFSSWIFNSEIRQQLNGIIFIYQQIKNGSPRE